MKQVLITFAENPTRDYPLAVVIVYPDGKRSQEHLVRCLRDARIFGNGMCCAMMHSHKGGEQDYPITPTVDPRLIEEAA